MKIMYQIGIRRGRIVSSHISHMSHNYFLFKIIVVVAVMTMTRRHSPQYFL